VWLFVCFFSRPGTVLTVQAVSEDDHRFWMHAMGGKEPVCQSLTSTSSYIQSKEISDYQLSKHEVHLSYNNIAKIMHFYIPQPTEVFTLYFRAF